MTTKSALAPEGIAMTMRFAAAVLALAVTVAVSPLRAAEFASDEKSNAEIGKNSIIAAGAVVLEGTKVESGTIYGGCPARKIKDIPADLIAGQIERIAKHYLMYAGWFSEVNATKEL